MEDEAERAAGHFVDHSLSHHRASYHKICYYIVPSRALPANSGVRSSATGLALSCQRDRVGTERSDRNENMEVFEVEHHQGPKVTHQLRRNNGSTTAVEDQIVAIQAHQQV